MSRETKGVDATKVHEKFRKTLLMAKKNVQSAYMGD